jgi:deoxyribonuclease-4
MTLQIGAHVSTAGGVQNSPGRGEDIGARCIQIFTRNQMSWKAKPLSEEEVNGFMDGRSEHGIETVMSHDSYLINLASPDPDKCRKSIETFEVELERCIDLGIELLNFHPGGHMGEGVEKGIRTLRSSLNGICARHPDGGVSLLLETVAGQGSSIGRSFEEVAAILEGLDEPDRFGVCVDTAHIFAAGYDISNEEGWEATWDNFDRALGMNRLRAVHVNDSRTGLGSNVDRHAMVGRGRIGSDAFTRLVTDERTRNVPMFLETPTSAEGYAMEIAWLSAASRGEVRELPEIGEVKRGA